MPRLSKANNERTNSEFKQTNLDSFKTSVENVGYQKKNECSKCNSQHTKYRPLVGENGDFLCDPCYKFLFPATAMCVEADGRRPFSDRGRLTKSKYSQKSEFPEEEECRICLHRGSFRRCCKKYYCHDCYNKTRRCPSCGKPGHRIGITKELPPR